MKKLLLFVISLAFFSFNTQEQKLLKFEFTIEETQLIYDALGELPAKKVEALRIKIITLAQKQIDTSGKK